MAIVLFNRRYGAVPERRGRLIELLRKISDCDVLRALEKRAKDEWGEPDFLWRGCVRAVLTAQGDFYTRIQDKDSRRFDRLQEMSDPEAESLFKGAKTAQEFSARSCHAARFRRCSFRHCAGFAGARLTGSDSRDLHRVGCGGCANRCAGR